MFIFFLSFIAGVLTVLAPCILTLLPVIVGGSIDGKPNMRRAFIVTGSLGVSVVVFTLLLKATTLLIDIPNTTWSIISGTIIIILGIFTVFPNLWENLGWLNSINRKSNEVIGAGYTKKSTWGDIITGAALGPVFSSCSPTYFFISHSSSSKPYCWFY
jgi:cytochrome c biogenesis protein CcdA